MLLLLPYCITASTFAGPVPEAGVNDSSVENLSEGSLRCFYSSIDELAAVSREHALAFHKVVSGIFRQVAVISIRFPTLLKSEEELRGFLRKQGLHYAAALERLRESVQMELRISSVRASAAQSPVSGRRYLEERRTIVRDLAAVAEQAHGRIQHLATAWRVHPGNRPDTLRCYALISRQAEKGFRHAIESLSVPQPVKIALSGPWPCNEFLE